MTTTQLHDAKTSDLIAFYNSKATKPVKKFADRKTAIARCLPFATTPKKAAGKATESTRNSFRPEHRIVAADQERAAAMRPTSRRYASFQLVGKNGTTVEKYIAGGGARLDLSKMVDLGIVRVIAA